MEGPGYFFQPTILRGVAEGTRILSEEIFGPVITVSGEDDALRLANRCEYGLVVYVCSTALNRGLRMGEKLETGMLGLNGTSSFIQVIFEVNVRATSHSSRSVAVDPGSPPPWAFRMRRR